MLSGADYLKMGYVSRNHSKDNVHHFVLGTILYRPADFATQVSLSLVLSASFAGSLLLSLFFFSRRYSVFSLSCFLFLFPSPSPLPRRRFHPRLIPLRSVKREGGYVEKTANCMCVCVCNSCVLHPTARNVTPHYSFLIFQRFFFLVPVPADRSQAREHVGHCYSRCEEAHDATHRRRQQIPAAQGPQQPPGEHLQGARRLV